MNPVSGGMFTNTIRDLMSYCAENVLYRARDGELFVVARTWMMLVVPLVFLLWSSDVLLTCSRLRGGPLSRKCLPELIEAYRLVPFKAVPVVRSMAVRVITGVYIKWINRCSADGIKIWHDVIYGYTGVQFRQHASIRVVQAQQTRFSSLFYFSSCLVERF